MIDDRDDLEPWVQSKILNLQKLLTLSLVTQNTIA